MNIFRLHLKSFKGKNLLLCLLAICFNTFVGVSQTNNMKSAHTWSKQELLKAGFKFYPNKNFISSKVIFGNKNHNGKLNGMIVSGTNELIDIAYIVDGEIAFPYLSAIDDDKYNTMSIHEGSISYDFKESDPISLISREIYGLDPYSDDLPARLCKGNYNYNNIVHCFDNFIKSGQKIPESAWNGYEINYDGISLNNSNPYPKWLKSSNLKSEFFSGPYTVKTWDRSTRKYITENDLESKLPNDVDLRLFGITFDYKPTSTKVTGGVLRINRNIEICVENGEIVIRSEVFSKKQWYTGCRIKSDTWNKISLYYTDGSLVLLSNGCAKLASFRIESPHNEWLYIKSTEAYDQPIGSVRNVKIEYIPR